MPPGTEEAIRAATSKGWEAVMVAVVMIAFMIAFSWVARTWFIREERMAKRIDVLEDFIRTELKELAVKCQASLDANTQAMANLSAVFNQRPCFFSDEKQESLLKHIAEETALKTYELSSKRERRFEA